jgi:DNA polymerase-3 subunit beta
MKIESAQDRLVEAIGKAEKITGKNLTLPVLGCILFEAKGKTLTLRATNLELGIELEVPVKVEKEGKVAVPGNIISSFLSTVKGENVTLESVEGNLKVSTAGTTTVIKALNHEDFPTIPHIKGERTATISARDFIKGIKAVWYSSATSSMKPELSSVYIHSEDDTLHFVATDSFRLAEKKVKIKNAGELGSILIPVKNIPEIMRILESAGDSVDVALTKNQIAFSFKGVYLTSRVVDGVFPDYRQIIPKGPTTNVVILKQDLINALRVATIFSDKFNKLNIKALPNKKKFEISTRNADVGENSSMLEAVFDGEDIDINFNHKYITECFQSVETDSLSLNFNGVTKPLVIKGVNDSSFLYLVMPINK